MAIFSVGWEDKIMQPNTRAAGAVLGVTVSGCGEMADSGRWMLDIYCRQTECKHHGRDN